MIIKFEALNSKSETNSNAQNSNAQNVSNFGFRVSDFPTEGRVYGAKG